MVQKEDYGNISPGGWRLEGYTYNEKEEMSKIKNIGS